VSFLISLVTAPWLAWGALLAAVFAASRHLLLVAASGRVRAATRRHGAPGKGKLRRLLRFVLLMPGPDSGALKSREQLLSGCGIAIDAGTYLLLRRAALAAAAGLAALLYASDGLGRIVPPAPRVMALAALAAAALALLADKPVLEMMMNHRRQRIVRDIFAISRQLLYLSGSPANLHGKLLRCLPNADAIRDEWYLLTSEWYQSPEEAIERFKKRLGTEEAFVFAETLNALRLNEHEGYYELLRQRIDEYKENLDLLRESRRETVSYLLFIMAGIPILFTFRLFVYPWVAEGQKLFDSLG